MSQAVTKLHSLKGNENIMHQLEFEFTVFVATEAGTDVYAGPPRPITYKHHTQTKVMTIWYDEGGSITAYCRDEQERPAYLYKVFVTQNVISTHRQPTLAENMQTEAVIKAYIKGFLAARYGAKIPESGHIGGA